MVVVTITDSPSALLSITPVVIIRSRYKFHLPALPAKNLRRFIIFSTSAMGKWEILSFFNTRTIVVQDVSPYPQVDGDNSEKMVGVH